MAVAPPRASNPVAAAVHAAAQRPASVGQSPVTHVGIAVADIEETVRHYQRVMGFGPPRISETAIDLPNGERDLTER